MIVFYGFGEMPRCEIVFTDYGIQPVEDYVVKRLRPEYEPGSGFMTEGISTSLRKHYGYE